MPNQAERFVIDLQLFAEEGEGTPTETVEGEGQESEVIEEVGGLEGDPPETAEPDDDFVEVKYNKEVVKVKKSEAPTYIQKGMNYDKVYGRTQELETALTRAAKITGHDTVDSFLKAVAEAESQAEMERYKDAGVTNPMVIQELIEKHPVIQQAKRTQHELGIAQQKEQYKDQTYFKELEPEIDQMVRGNPNIDVATAFYFLRGQKADELLAKATGEASRKAVDAHTRQSKRGVESSDDAPVSTKGLDFTTDEKQWAERRVRQGHYKSLTEAHKWLRGK